MRRREEVRNFVGASSERFARLLEVRGLVDVVDAVRTPALLRMATEVACRARVWTAGEALDGARAALAAAFEGLIQPFCSALQLRVGLEEGVYSGSRLLV
jgi:hypothetical protein